MKVVIASHNPAKIRAVTEAFALQFPEIDFEPVPVSVESGVSEQPLSDRETRHGARNRAHNASQLQPDAEFWVGLEGGIETIDDQLMAFGWKRMIPLSLIWIVLSTLAIGVRRFGLPWS